SFTPSKLKAPLIVPVVHTGPFTRVPVWPLPDASAALVPAPSSNFHCATKPAEVTASPGLLMLLYSVVIQSAERATFEMRISSSLPLYQSLVLPPLARTPIAVVSRELGLMLVRLDALLPALIY